MDTTTLQPPKSGKSRFSKALPAPPSFLKALKGLPSSPQPSKTHLPPARKPLPAVSGVPPTLPPKESSSSPASPSSTVPKPLDSPLPPVPPNSMKPSAPPPSIPRRPVAGGSPGLSPADDSPLSSLLSAYTDSNRSSHSTNLSSHDGATPASSAEESYPVSPKADSSPFAEPASSPKLDELFFAPLSIQSVENNGGQIQAQQTLPTKQGAESDTKQLPLPPLKDFDAGTQSLVQAERTTSSSNSPTPLVTHNVPLSSQGATLAQSPQPNPQLWRRRSLKAEKDLAVTDLKLVSSNGSTTTRSTVPAPEPPPKEPSPTSLQPQGSNPVLGVPAATRSPIPAPNTAFPGRNIRPVGSRQQLVQEGPDSMGQEASRVTKALKKTDHGAMEVTRQRDSPSPSRRASPPRATNHARNTSISSPIRLPTPEYDADDVKGPIVETIVSPVSPASSPELPSEPRPQRLPQVTKNIRSDGSQNSLAPKSSLQGLGVRSPIGLPSSPAASRTAPPTPQSHFPARTTSKAAANPSPDEQQPAPVSTLVQKGRTVSEVGSIETIKAARQEQFLPKPEIQQTQEEAQEDDTTEHPGAKRFPRGWKAEISKDTVFQPPPISEKHHRCMMRHRIMHETRNTYYPLACQACNVKDISWRYVCSCCNLRVCKSCRTSLRKYNGDLRALMKHNDTVIVEQSTESEFDHEEAAIQSGKASAAQQKATSQTARIG